MRSGTVIAEVNAAGSYYVLVDDSSDTDDYSITATYSSTTGARETESNDYLIYADILTSGVAVTGQTSSYSDDDLYRLDRQFCWNNYVRFYWRWFRLLFS